MTAETRQKVQFALIAVLVVTAIRTGYILYRRHEDAIAARQQIPHEIGYSNPDYYVVPKKLYPYDLKSAKQLTEQPVWVKEGYRYTYFPYNPETKKVDFDHDAGLLLPIEKLSIQDVILTNSSGKGIPPQVVAIFQKAGKDYAVPIGLEKEGQFKIYSDEMFYIQDPRDLYKWPADVWQAVDQHQVKQGMNELQADFAVGMGVPDAGASSSEKTVRYPNGGKPLVVVYDNGKAAEVRSGS